MHKVKRNLIITILLIQFIFLSNILVINGLAAEEIEPEYGDSPKIDGKIDGGENEWKNATKTSINLYDNKSQTDKGIPIELWVMQDETHLFISVQFSLESHDTTEFIGILISERGSDGENDDDFVDAKILQFTDIKDNEYSFKDYYIEDEIFEEDEDKDGKAAGRLSEDEVIYEFSIPINNTNAEDDDEDVFLDFGEEYAFRIIYGVSSDYPDSIAKYNTVIISIEYPPVEPEREWWIDVHNILLIITFIGTSVLCALYVYKILLLNKNLERLTENA